MIASLFTRLGSDFWPLDRSYVAPNLVAAAVQGVVVFVVVYAVWKPLRERVDNWVRAHLHAHHLTHVAPHHDAVLEEIGKLRSLVESLLHPPASPTTKEAPMGILSEIASDIEKRFRYHPNATELTAQAHEKVRALLESTAKELVAITGEVAPQAHEASLMLTKLEEAGMWAHAHIARNQATPAAAPDDTGTPPAAAPAEPAPTPAPVPEAPAAPVATEAAAPVEAAPAATEAPAPAAAPPATA